MRVLRYIINLLCALVISGTAAAAEDWPKASRIRFIVPFPAGGSTDVTARLIGDFLSKSLGQAVIVENISGGGGNIGPTVASKAAPDGYTILIAPDSMSSAPHVFKVAFDPIKDFAPIIQLTRQPVVLAVHPSLGVSTLAELIRLAKEHPDLAFGTSGVGSQQHMVGEWFAKLAGIKLTHVPYRGGGAAINDLLAGQIKIGSLGSAPVMPQFKAGSLKILAQSTKRRAPDLPDVPTYGEAGFPDIVLDQWVGAFAPAGTPPPIIERLQIEMTKALADKDVRAKMATLALEPVGGTSAEFGLLIKDDFDKYARLVKELDIKFAN